MKYIYLIQSLDNGYYKIGVSKNPLKRLKQLKTGNSSELKLIYTYPSKYAHKIEKTIHNLFLYSKKEGEWFDICISEVTTFNDKCKKIEENINILKRNGNVFI